MSEKYFGNEHCPPEPGISFRQIERLRKEQQNVANSGLIASKGVVMP
jgi:hypothetical protein